MHKNAGVLQAKNSSTSSLVRKSSLLRRVYGELNIWRLLEIVLEVRGTTARILSLHFFECSLHVLCSLLSGNVSCFASSFACTPITVSFWTGECIITSLLCCYQRQSNRSCDPLLQRQTRPAYIIPCYGFCRYWLLRIRSWFSWLCLSTAVRLFSESLWLCVYR
jgi:hypothetical protein